MKIASNLTIALCTFPVALLFAAAEVRGEVRLIEHEQTYTVDAIQPKSFRKQLMQHLEQREPGANSRTHGLTHADMEVQYQLMPKPAGECRIEAARVTLTLQLEAPRWEPVAEPSEAMLEGGNATLRALSQHGLQHREHAVRAAEDIDAALRALLPAPDCHRARRDADHVIRLGRTRLRSEDLAYDRSSEFRNSARPTLGLASAGPKAPTHVPAASRGGRRGRSVSVAQLYTMGQ